MLEAARQHGGITWTKLRELVTGKTKAQQTVRDRLIADGLLVNTRTRPLQA